MADAAQLKQRLADEGYTLVLGSSSVWRKRILANMGFDFETSSPDIDEKAIRDASPDKMTLMIAKAKAHALLDKFKDQKVILICSDQVILCNGVVREKPIDVEQARGFLNSYSTYPATAVDGIVVINTATGKTIEHVERATQHFKTLPAEFIEGMIKQGDVMWCAGGFTVEHMTEYLGELEGEQSTIEGLPQTAILRLVTEALSNSDNTMSSS